MSRAPFAFFDLPAGRSRDKPRGRGRTIMLDRGLGLVRVEDTLRVAGAQVDLVRFAVGTARLYDEELLREKLARYAAHQVRAFPGGEFIEHHLAASAMRAMPAFFEEARRVGFDVIEVSQRLRPLSDDAHRRLLALALEQRLGVLARVGASPDEQGAGTLVTRAETCLAAGCELVIVDGAALIERAAPNRALLATLAASLDLDRIVFELPGPSTPGASPAAVDALRRLLIGELGVDVNLGNVLPDEVLETEALRAGLADMRLSDGARRVQIGAET